MVLHCVGMPKGFLVLQEFHFRPFGIVITCFGPGFSFFLDVVMVLE